MHYFIHLSFLGGEDNQNSSSYFEIYIIANSCHGHHSMQWKASLVPHLSL